MLDDGRVRPASDRVVPVSELPAAMKTAWEVHVHEIVLDERWS